MKLAALQWVVDKWAKYRYFQHIERIDDNLFFLRLDNDSFYIDLTKGMSTIFIAPDFLSTKAYHAPFDLSIRCCNKGIIQKIDIDGLNRILRFYIAQKHSYKHENYVLQFEFTGRNTNAILLKNNIVVDALRQIKRSFRVVKINAPLDPLPQPKQAPCESPLPDVEFVNFLQNNYESILYKKLSSTKSNAIAHINKKIIKAQELLQGVQDSDLLQTQALALQNHAKLLLAHIHTLALPIQAKLEIRDMDDTIHQIAIPESAQSYSHAAQLMFSQAKKMLQRAQNMHIQADFLHEKMSFLRCQIELINASTNLHDIAIYAQQHARKKQKKKEEYESFFVSGVKISFGKNKQENIALLRDARATDIWMHIRCIPSSHMIVRPLNKNVAPQVLKKAAEILVGFAKTQAGNYEVDWTQRRFVKIIDGANVHYAKHQTLIIKKERL